MKMNVGKCSLLAINIQVQQLFVILGAKVQEMLTGSFDETAPDKRPIAEYSSLPVAGGKSPRISQK